MNRQEIAKRGRQAREIVSNPVWQFMKESIVEEAKTEMLNAQSDSETLSHKAEIKAFLKMVDFFEETIINANIDGDTE